MTLSFADTLQEIFQWISEQHKLKSNIIITYLTEPVAYIERKQRKVLQRWFTVGKFR